MNGKRILVLADTHGIAEAWKKAIGQAGQVDMIFHLGDNVRDAVAIADSTKVKVICVRGNCDFGGAEAEETVMVGSKKLFLTHGHRYGVKYTIDRLCYAAAENGANAAFFGHTHQPLIEYYNGILIMNPGSVGAPRGGRGTFGLVIVNEQGIFPRIAELVYS